MEEKTRLSGYRWVILLAGSLITFMANYMQYQVSAWGVEVMEMLGTDVAGLTNLMLLPMFVAVFLSIPCGTIADRIGVKKVVSIGVVLSVIGAFLRTFALTSFPAQCAGMLLIGAGIASLNCNLQKVYGTWFKEHISIAIGVFTAAACAGCVLAQAASTLFDSLFTSYLVAAVVQAVCAVVWIVFMKNTPVGEALPEPEEGAKYLSVVIKNRYVWMLGIASGMILAADTAFTGLLPSALELGKGVETTMAGTMASILTVGSFVACFVGPAIFMKIGKFKPYLFVATSLGGIALIATWFVPMGGTMWAMLVLTGFLSALSGPIVDSMLPSLPGVGVKYAGSAGGVYATLTVLFSYFLPQVISGIFGDNWMLNLGIEGVLFIASLLFIALIPEPKEPLEDDGELLEDKSSDVASLSASA